MHADRDDAPLRNQKKSGILKWMVALGIGTGITAGMLFVASMNAGKNQLKSALTVTTSTPAEDIQPKPEKKQEIDWDKVVEEQARRDAGTPRIVSRSEEAAAQKLKDEAERERRANEAIAILNAKNFGEGVVAETQKKKGKQEIVIVGKESRISDFCPGGEGSIMRRNCKQRVNLNTRN